MQEGVGVGQPGRLARYGEGHLVSVFIGHLEIDSRHRLPLLVRLVARNRDLGRTVRRRRGCGHGDGEGPRHGGVHAVVGGDGDRVVLGGCTGGHRALQEGVGVGQPGRLARYGEGHLVSVFIGHLEIDSRHRLPLLVRLVARNRDLGRTVRRRRGCGHGDGEGPRHGGVHAVVGGDGDRVVLGGCTGGHRTLQEGVGVGQPGRRARYGCGHLVAVDVGHLEIDSRDRLPLLVSLVARHRDLRRRIQCGLYRKLARRGIGIAPRVPGHTRRHVDGHRPAGPRRDRDRIAGPRTGESSHRPVTHRHVPLLKGMPVHTHRLRELDSHSERTVLSPRRTGDVNRWWIQVRRPGVPGRRAVAVSGVIESHVRGHVHRHDAGRRRLEGDLIISPRTGEGHNRSVAHRHVALLEPGHRHGKGDVHNKWMAPQRVRRTAEADRGVVGDRVRRKHQQDGGSEQEGLRRQRC